MDGHGGDRRDENTFDTSASRMISCVAEVPASRVVCTFEEGPLAGWAARALHEHVDKLIVCAPQENDSISDAIHKSDSPNTYEPCRLLRLGGLKAVYPPDDDRRLRPPYGGGRDTAEATDYHSLDAIGPAGSINSSVSEMANWVQLFLNDGAAP